MANVELTYVNTSEISPIECTYIFPVDDCQILTKFEAFIDGNIIKTEVKSKERAQQIYDDAVAGGNTAVLVERSKKKEESM